MPRSDAPSEPTAAIMVDAPSPLELAMREWMDLTRKVLGDVGDSMPWEEEPHYLVGNFMGKWLEALANSDGGDMTITRHALEQLVKDASAQATHYRSEYGPGVEVEAPALANGDVPEPVDGSDAAPNP